jgi:hypothetical protein
MRRQQELAVGADQAGQHRVRVPGVAGIAAELGLAGTGIECIQPVGVVRIDVPDGLERTNVIGGQVGQPAVDRIGRIAVSVGDLGRPPAKEAGDLA